MSMLGALPVLTNRTLEDFNSFLARTVPTTNTKRMIVTKTSATNVALQELVQPNNFLQVDSLHQRHCRCIDGSQDQA